MTDDNNEANGRINIKSHGETVEISDRDGNTAELEADDVPFIVGSTAGAIDRGDVLIGAWQIAAERGAKYGPPDENMAAAARLMDGYVKNLVHQKAGMRIDETLIEEGDVPQLMMLLKMARYQTGGPSRDAFTDQAGYARVTAEVEGVHDE